MERGGARGRTGPGGKDDCWDGSLGQDERGGVKGKRAGGHGRAEGMGLGWGGRNPAASNAGLGSGKE